MIRSSWTPVAGMWLILALTLMAGGDHLAAWLSLACLGLSVLSGIVDHLGRREVTLLRKISRVQTARLRNHEKDTNVHIR